MKKFFRVVVYTTGINETGSYGRDILATGTFVAKEDAEKAGEDYCYGKSSCSYEVTEVTLNELTEC